MFLKNGITEGYSFLQHGGMWYDALFIAPLVAYMVATYDLPYVSLLGEVSLTVSIVTWFILAAQFKSSPVPEAHTHHHSITPAGFVHLVFAVLAMWVMIMFYSIHPPMRYLVIVSSILTPFFFFGIYKFDRKWRFNRLAVGIALGGPMILWLVVLLR
jgi:hypothetical protein